MSSEQELNDEYCHAYFTNNCGFESIKPVEGEGEQEQDTTKKKMGRPKKIKD